MTSTTNTAGTSEVQVASRQATEQSTPPTESTTTTSTPKQEASSSQKKDKDLADSRRATEKTSAPSSSTSQPAITMFIGPLSAKQNNCVVVNPAMGPGEVALAGSRLTTVAPTTATPPTNATTPKPQAPSSQKKHRGMKHSRSAKAQCSTTSPAKSPKPEKKSLIGSLSAEERKCVVVNPAMLPGEVGLAGSRWALPSDNLKFPITTPPTITITPPTTTITPKPKATASSQKKDKDLDHSRPATDKVSAPSPTSSPKPERKSLIGSLSAEEKKCVVINPAMVPGEVGLASSRWA